MFDVSTIAPNPPIHPRFVVLKVLEPADFGWGYLVKDLHRPGTPWVLEEFLPSAETPDNLVNVQNALRSAIEPLIQINHPQLAISQDVVLLGDRLFLIREYVQGTSYRVLLDQRLEQGEAFTELEVRLLMLQILPVLEALHQQQIFHHQLDLHNIVQRQSDQLVVLSRFGEMRDLGLAARFYLLNPLQSWSLEAGLEGVDRDLHDLAYVALTLITGNDVPNSLTELIQAALEQNYLSQEFATILDRMLIPKPWQQFRSAQEVEAALIEMNQPTKLRMQNVTPTPLEVAEDEEEYFEEELPNQHRDPILLILSIVFITLMSIALWRIAAVLPQLPKIGLFKPSDSTAVKPAAKSSAKPLNNVTKQPENSDSTDQAEKLGITLELLDRLNQEIPHSTESLNQQLHQLSKEARNGMGTYYRRDYERWLVTLADMNISQPTIDVLADTLFYLRFPDLQGKPLNPRSLGQVWYAIARDQITDLNRRKQIEILKAGTFNQAGKLSNGQSRVFQVKVNSGQGLELKIDDKMDALRLSVIENEIVLTRYTTNAQWSAPKSLQGRTYEIILTPMSLDAVPYKISMSSPGQ